MKFIDLTGQKIRTWIVLKRVPNRNRHIYWLCKCECGIEKIIIGQSLRNGKSIGCHHYRNNEERFLRAREQYYINNKKKIKEYQKQYYIDNKEKIKQYDNDNKEKIKEYKQKYYQENKEKLNEDNRKWIKNKRKTDIKFNLVSKIRFAIWKTLKGNKNGWHWEDLVGYTSTDLMNRLIKTLPEGYCWNDYLLGKLHIDHIIPIKAFVFESPEDEEFKNCWDLYNLRLLPAKENILKKDNFDNPILLSLLIELIQKK